MNFVGRVFIFFIFFYKFLKFFFDFFLLFSGFLKLNDIFLRRCCDFSPESYVKLIRSGSICCSIIPNIAQFIGTYSPKKPSNYIQKSYFTAHRGEWITLKLFLMVDTRNRFFAPKNLRVSILKTSTSMYMVRIPKWVKPLLVCPLLLGPNITIL